MSEHTECVVLWMAAYFNLRRQCAIYDRMVERLGERKGARRSKIPFGDGKVVRLRENIPLPVLRTILRSSAGRFKLPRLEYWTGLTERGRQAPPHRALVAAGPLVSHEVPSDEWQRNLRSSHRGPPNIAQPDWDHLGY